MFISQQPYMVSHVGWQVTLLREFSQGINDMLWVLPTGGFDPKKHASLKACAQAELSEEV